MPIDGKGQGRHRKVALEINPESAPIVRQMFETLAGGGTLRGVADALNAQGVPTITGRSQYWIASTIRDIVTNPTYMGKRVALRHARVTSTFGRPTKQRRPDEETVSFPDAIAPAIVDAATFQAVMERLAPNKRESRRRLTGAEAKRFLLRAGHIECGHCGSAMSVIRHVNTSTSKAPVYACKRRSASAFHPCSGVKISTHIIDGIVWDRVSEVLTQPDVVARELERVSADDPVVGDLEVVGRTLADVARRCNNLVAGLADADDPDTRAALTAALAKLAEQARGLEATRDELNGRRGAWEEARQRIGDIRSWCARVAATLGDLTYAEKRNTLAALAVTARMFRTGQSEPVGDHARLPISGRRGTERHSSTSRGSPMRCSP